VVDTLLRSRCDLMVNTWHTSAAWYHSENAVKYTELRLHLVAIESKQLSEVNGIRKHSAIGIVHESVFDARAYFSYSISK